MTDRRPPEPFVVFPGVGMTDALRWYPGPGLLAMGWSSIRLDVDQAARLGEALTKWAEDWRRAGVPSQKRSSTDTPGDCRTGPAPERS